MIPLTLTLSRQGRENEGYLLAGRREILHPDKPGLRMTDGYESGLGNLVTYVEQDTVRLYNIAQRLLRRPDLSGLLAIARRADIKARAKAVG
jgi:hypothetical protein